MDRKEKVEETVNKLCDWIQQVVEAKPDPGRISLLPEVIKATAELNESIR